MISHKGEFVINADQKAVFNYMDDPKNAALATPNVTDSDILTDKDDEKRLRAYYSLGPIDGELDLEMIDRREYDMIKYTIDGDISGVVTWEFEKINDSRTTFSYVAEYELERISAPDFLVKKATKYIENKNIDKFKSDIRSDIE